jgi:hypothetical protein
MLHLCRVIKLAAIRGRQGKRTRGGSCVNRVGTGESTPGSRCVGKERNDWNPKFVLRNDTLLSQAEFTRARVTRGRDREG